MAKTTVDEMVRGASEDPLFAQAYNSPKARIRRAMGEALFRLRKGTNLTQAALAERAGWQQPYVAKIERGDAQMITSLEGLEAFANAAGASALVVFVDRTSGAVRAQVPLGAAEATDPGQTRFGIEEFRVPQLQGSPIASVGRAREQVMQALAELDRLAASERTPVGKR